MLRLKRRGQSTAEYAIVIGLVIAAAVAMQIYVKRGLQGKIKDAVDITVTETGSGTVIGGGHPQYEPYYQSSNMQGTHVASVTENTATGGGVTRTTGNDTSTRTGTSTVSDTKSAD